MVIAPFIISVREGIEAALIIAVMLSFLRKTKRMNLSRFVYLGSIGAVITSLGVSAALSLIWGFFEGAALQIFEGVIVIIASILLTTMIIWMNRVGSSISSEIESAAKDSMVAKGGFGLGVLAFALILREGVELSLFTIALVVQEGGGAYIGVFLGLIAAVILGYAIYRGSLRISFSAFFKWTSVFLVLFAAGMIAYGIHELQEAGLLLIGPLEVWDVNPAPLADGGYPLLHENGAIGALLKSLFGYNGNPSALEVAAYAGYVLIVGVYFISRRRKGKKQAKETQQVHMKAEGPL